MKLQEMLEKELKPVVTEEILDGDSEEFNNLHKDTTSKNMQNKIEELKKKKEDYIKKIDDEIKQVMEQGKKDDAKK